MSQPACNANWRLDFSLCNVASCYYLLTILLKKKDLLPVHMKAEINVHSERERGKTFPFGN